MPGLLIRNISPELYQRLRASAAKHHRSISKEALAILEDALRDASINGELPRPLKGRFPITQEFLEEARKEGRE